MGQDVSFRWQGAPSRSPLPSHLASLLSAVTRAAVAFAPWESLREGIADLGLASPSGSEWPRALPQLHLIHSSVCPAQHDLAGRAEKPKLQSLGTVTGGILGAVDEAEFQQLGRYPVHN